MKVSFVLATVFSLLSLCALQGATVPCSAYLTDSSLNATEVVWSPEKSEVYLGTPSIVRLANGHVLISHDTFGPGSNVTSYTPSGLDVMSVFLSIDNGTTWTRQSTLADQYWSTLFIVEPSAVYLLGTDTQYGSIVIRKSEDEGVTWTTPTDAGSGMLYPSGQGEQAPNYHTSATPVVLSPDGYIYKAFESYSGSWPPQDALIISAKIGSDLLKASSWSMSTMLRFSPNMLPREWQSEMANPGWLEGNAVLMPNGSIADILRFHSVPLVNKAALLVLSGAGELVVGDFIDPFYGGLSKFTIKFDPLTRRYLSITSYVTDAPCRPFVSKCVAEPAVPLSRDFGPCCARNQLWLVSSKDLQQWTVHDQLLADDTGLNENDSNRLTGLQYADWVMDGDDLLVAVRAAYRGAVGYHRSNRILMKVVENFRSLL